MYEMKILFVILASFASSGVLFGCGQADLLEDGLVVNITQGPVRGVRATDGNFTLFMGIPYATVDPDNKFAPALAPPTWEEVRDVDDDSTKCPQREEYNNTLTGVYDCLVLNVYVPDSASQETPLPVMFNIHGGYYSIGWGGRIQLGPDYLMDRDNVILVTSNYRLGLYGFSCLGIEGAPGNVGFKDQVAALRWVQTNIAAFGGDPNTVTIFGNSAGSSAVEYHILSPMSRGLFHRAISESGSAIGTQLTTDEQTSEAKLLAAQLGLVTDDVEELLVFFQSSEPFDLIVAAEAAGTPFRLCVENEIGNEEPFMTDTPLNILKSGDYESVPYLAGFNDREGLIIVGTSILSAEAIFENNIPVSLPYETEEERTEKIQLIKEFYIGDQSWNETSVYVLVDFITDSLILSHVAKSLRLHVNKSSEVFFYELAYHGQLGYVQRRENITLPGMSHADELGYLFLQGTERYEVLPEDQVFLDRVTTMWTNFAKYGNPTPNVTELLPVKWEPMTVDSVNYLHVDTEMEMRRQPYHQRVAFWNMIYLNQS